MYSGVMSFLTPAVCKFRNRNGENKIKIKLHAL
jgi:hypothetical protein